MKQRVLVVDDEKDMLEACLEALEPVDARVEGASSGSEAWQRLQSARYDAVISDIKMPDLDGIELVRRLREKSPETAVILMTAFPKIDTAVEALRLGALDYLIKPIHPEALLRRVERALNERRLEADNRVLSRQLDRPYRKTDILGESPAIAEALRLIDRVAPLPADVLLLGESGTGKELAARRLHQLSRRPGRFVPLDCGAIPENLLENELFGHERGAYTDARGSTQGLFEFADRGTLFMDEIAEMPLSLQVKLLRTLQERQIRRVGGQQLIPVDVRIIAATNRDIAAEVRAGRFRQDLYYRINAVTLRLPPLRDRNGDVGRLAKAFVERFASELGRPVAAISPQAVAVLEHYRWPGNIRELENAIRRAVALAEGSEIRIDDLPEAVALQRDAQPSGDSFVDQRGRLLETFEGRYFRELMARHPKDAKAAAAEAGIPLSSFYRFLKKYRLE